MLKDACKAVVQEARDSGTFKVERVIENAQDMKIQANGKEVLNFCANNYLGLANHPRIT